MAVDGRSGSLPPWLDRLGERVNPVLVKEVRAALRGRAFTIGFVVLLCLAAAGSLIALIAGSSLEPGARGNAYVMGVGVVFAIGAYCFVPFWALASMSAEHEDGAIEQLQLSGLSAGRMVRGKLGGALVLAALLYAAFLPFLAFATLLPGVDPLGTLSGVAGSIAGVVTLASIGLLIGATLKRRAARVFGFVLLVIVMIVGFQVLAALTMMLSMGGVGGSGVLPQFLATLSFCGLVTAICCVMAAAWLTHAEENRSTGFRVVGTASTTVVCAFALWSDTPEALLVLLLVALAVGIPTLALAATERERLPRAVLLRALRGRTTPWFLAPWLPGGGRGVLLVFVHVVLILGAGAWAAIRLRPADALPHLGAVACVTLYVATALLLPAGLLARWMSWTWAQILARLAIFLLPIGALLLPALIRFLTKTGAEFRHVGNPAHLAMDLVGDGRLDDRLGLAVLLGLLVLAVALNVPRVLRSLGELSRERARRAAGAASAAPETAHAAPQP